MSLPGCRVCIHSFGLTTNAPHLPRAASARACDSCTRHSCAACIWIELAPGYILWLGPANHLPAALPPRSSPLLLCIPNYGAEFRARDNRGFSLISSLNRVISETASTFPPRIHAKTYPFSQLYPPASNLSSSKFSIRPGFWVVASLRIVPPRCWGTSLSFALLILLINIEFISCVIRRERFDDILSRKPLTSEPKGIWFST